MITFGKPAKLIETEKFKGGLSNAWGDPSIQRNVILADSSNRERLTSSYAAKAADSTLKIIIMTWKLVHLIL